MKEFLIILLKAEVKTETICKICCDVLGFKNEEDKKAEEVILEIVEHPERVIQGRCPTKVYHRLFSGQERHFSRHKNTVVLSEATEKDCACSGYY